MSARLTLDHPVIDNINPQTAISTDYASGTSLLVQNNADFANNDYILLGKYGDFNAEVVQVSSKTGLGTITLVAGGNFSHPSDTPVTKMDYNQFKIYRSTTGVGGSYSLLDTKGLFVDQPFNYYYDSTGQSPYSYQFTFYNSSASVETSRSSEIPFTGFAMSTLRGLQDQVISMFGDIDLNFITRKDLTNYLNECTQNLQWEISGGDSPYYLNSYVITSTDAVSYDVSTQAMKAIYLIEYSMDGGTTYINTINPQQFQFNGTTEGTAYGWRLESSTLFFNSPVPSGYLIRIWYQTDPTLLSSQSDAVPNPFVGHTELYVDYALSRCHEKDRKVTELSAYYRILYEKLRDRVIPQLKNRIKSGNKIMATTWADDYLD